VFPRYLQYLLTDFRQTFVTGASWDKDELIRFWGQKIKGQGHIIVAELSSSDATVEWNFLVCILLRLVVVGITYIVMCYAKGTDSEFNKGPN